MRCASPTSPQPGTVLRVSQRIAAGRVGTALEPGSAARIFTGAQIPAGADAVVMQELCTPVDGGVRIDAAPAAGQSIRRRGEDVRRDATVLRAGLRLGPQALGMAASVGAATLQGGRAAPGRAVLHRRRAGDARRGAQAGRDLQLQPLHPARPDPGDGRRLRRPRHRSRPARRHPRDAAPRRRRQRPDRHLRRHVGRRRGPHEAGGRAGRAARHVADRDQARASRWPSARSFAATARRPGSSACPAIRCRPS